MELHIVPILVGGALLLALLVPLLWWAGRLAGREPYRAILRLRTRAKLRFVRRAIADPGVPRAVKVLPFLLAAYLASPIDLIPDFVPGLGYLDDVAVVVLTLWLMIRLTPPEVVARLIAEADEEVSRTPDPRLGP